jgi:magnesium transporter
VIAAASYVGGHKLADFDPRVAGAARAAGGEFFWIGLAEPDDDELGQILGHLDIPMLAIEEAQRHHRRPKIVEYGALVLVVAATVETAGEKLRFGETQLLLGPHYLVTIRRGTTASYMPLRRRLEECPDLISRGTDFIASELIDLLIEQYAQAAGISGSEVRKLYRLRRNLLQLHGALTPMVEICRRLSRIETRSIDLESRPYFAEAADRAQRVGESLAMLRETLAFAFEASQMLGQAQQTEITRRLAAWGAILAVPTAIAGIYGMNFENMPELKWAYGYFAVITVIAAICGYLYRRFRRAGWL